MWRGDNPQLTSPPSIPRRHAVNHYRRQVQETEAIKTFDGSIRTRPFYQSLLALLEPRGPAIGSWDVGCCSSKQQVKAMQGLRSLAFACWRKFKTEVARLLTNLGSFTASDCDGEHGGRVFFSVSSRDKH